MREDMPLEEQIDVLNLYVDRLRYHLRVAKWRINALLDDDIHACEDADKALPGMLAALEEDPRND